MVKVIIQITKIVITAVMALFMSSCVNFKTISGNGNVRMSNRTTAERFTSVEVRTGLDVVLEQGSPANIEVEADENLQEHIITKIENGVLKIYTDASIFRSKKLKVYVRTPELTKVEASSGASVSGIGSISAEELSVISSSGSEIELNVNAGRLSCDSSSGSEIEIKGTAENVLTDASSGSDIDLEELTAESVTAHSSSGSSITVKPKNRLKAEASSGGSIEYVSAPKEISINESSGGSVFSKR